MPDTYPLLAVKGLETTTARFREQLVAGALSKGLNPDFIAAVVSFESGFNPAVKNQAGSGAVGLIQWISDQSFAATAKKAGMQVTRTELPKLTAEQQLPLVLAWFSDKSLKASSTPVDYYLAVWSPAYIGRSRDYVVAEEGSKVYEQNAGFDREGKGYFTVGDIGKTIEAVVGAARGRPPIPVPLSRTTPILPGVSLGSVSPLPSLSHPPAPTFTPAEKALAGLPVELPLLERGNHGPAVALLQQLLNLSARDDGQAPLVVDGKFGEHTEAALGLHQVDQHVDPSGECDARTWDTFIRNRTWALDHIGLLMRDEDLEL